MLNFARLFRRFIIPLPVSSLNVFHVVWHFLPGLQLDVSFLPVGPKTERPPPPPDLAVIDSRMHGVYFHFKDGLNRGFDFHLGGVTLHPETKRPGALLYVQPFFGDDGLL